MPIFSESHFIFWDSLKHSNGEDPGPSPNGGTLKLPFWLVFSLLPNTGVFKLGNENGGYSLCQRLISCAPGKMWLTELMSVAGDGSLWETAETYQVPHLQIRRNDWCVSPHGGSQQRPPKLARSLARKHTSSSRCMVGTQGQRNLEVFQVFVSVEYQPKQTWPTGTCTQLGQANTYPSHLGCMASGNTAFLQPLWSSNVLLRFVVPCIIVLQDGAEGRVKRKKKKGKCGNLSPLSKLRTEARKIPHYLG